jgi:hypothetical protein
MNLRKFPVTAPDGTEYRVEITEGRLDAYGPYVHVDVMVRARRRRFNKVGARRFFAWDRHYIEADPDYVGLAAQAVRELAPKQDAVDRFNAWDGRIETEETV